MVDDRAPDPLSAVAKAAGERLCDVGEIGRGGMGCVRRVYDTLLRREVAMKVSDPESPEYTQAALRFMEEAQITGQLDHPNIVAVHDLFTGQDARGVYFTMKLVEGETLTEQIAAMHRVPYDHVAIERVLRVLVKVCEALAFAHARGVIHRDLKPDNVMVGSYGQVYLMDWGVALLSPSAGAPASSSRVTLSEDLARGSLDEHGSIVGTFEYMAPEQAWGKTTEIDARTDVFGLGSILYHLLVGRGPNASPTAFTALQRAQRCRPTPADEAAAWPNLPPGLCRITMKALSKAPEERYPSVDALREDVEDFLRGGGWFETRVFPPGGVIVRQGDSAEMAYIIVSGSCEVYKTTDGAPTLLRVLRPGDVFGETAILTGEPRSASVVAVDEVVAKVVTRDALEKELGRGSWAGAFVKALAERFRDVDEKLAKLRATTR
ncbi:MAG TPA: cyclic nucleotide-binding domain-containing protein [Polyangiaceae bacterium]|jgi:serine/threonine-protein kinase|nr:cyclic nucleotide-binding domain-containing protein [Polyangiaceae bacterium]